MEALALPLPPLNDLYREHRRKALAIVRRILHDQDEAEDVVQDVFTKLFSQKVRFDGKAAYSTWLHRILVNSSINSLRARRRRGKLATGPEEGDGPLEQVLNEERHDAFVRALAKLSEQHRTLLTLRELRGYSYPEIANLLRVPEGTVKSALNRGRARLLEVMAEQGTLESEH